MRCKISETGGSFVANFSRHVMPLSVTSLVMWPDMCRLDDRYHSDIHRASTVRLTVWRRDPPESMSGAGDRGSCVPMFRSSKTRWRTVLGISVDDNSILQSSWEIINTVSASSTRLDQDLLDETIHMLGKQSTSRKGYTLRFTLNTCTLKKDRRVNVATNLSWLSIRLLLLGRDLQVECQFNRFTFIFGSWLYDIRTRSWRKVVCRRSGQDSTKSISSNATVFFHESRKLSWFAMYMWQYRTDNNRQCWISSCSSGWKQT